MSKHERLKRDNILKINEKFGRWVAPLLNGSPLAWMGRTRVWKDGRISLLSSHLSLLKTTINEDLHLSIPAFELFDPKNQGLWTHEYWIKAEDPAFYANVAAHVNRVDTTFTIIEKNDIYCDIFYFGDNRDDMSIINYYFTHEDVLQNLIQQFKKDGHDIDQEINQESIIVKPSTRNTPSFAEAGKLIQSFLKNRLRILLTIKESQIFSMYLLRFTAQQMASHFNLSVRTIENNIYSVREKLNFNNLNELFFLMQKNGVMDLLHRLLPIEGLYFSVDKLAV